MPCAVPHLAGMWERGLGELPSDLCKSCSSQALGWSRTLPCQDISVFPTCGGKDAEWSKNIWKPKCKGNTGCSDLFPKLSSSHMSITCLRVICPYSVVPSLHEWQQVSPAFLTSVFPALRAPKATVSILRTASMFC